jgi:DNA mismatch repair protein MutS
MEYSPVVKEYIDLEQSYISKYGDRIVLLIQVGDFMELYFGLENEARADLICCKILNIRKRKNKNYYTAGFPIDSTKKFVNILTVNNYIAVLYTQADDSNKKSKKKIRVFNSIYSEATNTNLDETDIGTDCVNIISIYIEFDNLKITECNICTIDTTTGNSNAILINANSYNEIIRIVNIYNPRQILINTENCVINENDIIRELNLKNKLAHIRINKIPSDYKKIPYQDKFLGSVFGAGLVSPIEYLNLEKYPSMIISYICLLNLICEFNNSLISNLSIPKIVNYKQTVNLSENTITQLNLIDKHSYSLLNLLNLTLTNGGKRLLSNRILLPSTDISLIQYRYNDIEKMIPVHEEFTDFLNSIRDLERLHRKIYIFKLHPNDFYNLSDSYKSLCKILELGLKYNLCNKILNPELYNKFIIFYNYYNNLFDLNNFVNINLESEYPKNIFKFGIYSDLDTLYKYLTDLNFLIENYAKVYATTVNDSEPFKIDYLPTEGHFLVCTKRKRDLLLLSFPDISSIDRSANCKISNPQIKHCSSEIVRISRECNKICNSRYLEFLNYITLNCKELLSNIAEIVNEIDLLYSNARCVSKYKLCKPKITADNSKAFLNAVDLRHLIIENVNKNIPFIPNDVDIGTQIDTMLIYALNGAGKSSIGKSIAIGIILAQCGFYVPATSFTYKPYNYILTKINITDNIYKAKSTFINEILELKNFLTYNSPDTLIIADELAKGTENKSEISLVGAAIKTLTTQRSSTVFLTHISELTDLTLLKPLKNIGVFHISTHTDTNGNIVYNRKLKPGKCTDKYGIEIASCLGLDKSFIETAYKIRNELCESIESQLKQEGESEEIYNIRKSRYNSNLIVDKCAVCNSVKNLHTHHITAQKEFVNNNNIPFEKNALHNLVVLCEDCHNSVHHKNLQINGYISTTDGIKLDYVYV